ncbi:MULTISPECIES: hypothetical protein [unclassified Streptomyces]|uniref:hypothetical protein n=1 Tax=unclassified Streptomyces TaxID=2593676 RepID=UPI001EEFA72B|nr:MULTISPECIES: hypothetical protein [unclassified Streptomyces]
MNASVLIHDGHGRYLLHLRDHKPGVIRQSGAFDLLGDRRGRGSAAGPSSWIPAPDDAYGYWLATARPAPGLVRDFQAETMTIATPAEGSWRSPVPARTLSASMGPGRGGPNSRTCTPAGSVPGCLMRTG